MSLAVWNSTTNYVLGDIVSYNNTLYRCIAPNSNIDPINGLGAEWSYATPTTRPISYAQVYSDVSSAYATTSAKLIATNVIIAQNANYNFTTGYYSLNYDGVYKITANVSAKRFAPNGYSGSEVFFKVNDLSPPIDGYGSFIAQNEDDASTQIINTITKFNSFNIALYGVSFAANQDYVADAGSLPLYPETPSFSFAIRQLI